MTDFDTVWTVIELNSY